MDKTFETINTVHRIIFCSTLGSRLYPPTSPEFFFYNGKHTGQLPHPYPIFGSQDSGHFIHYVICRVLSDANIYRYTLLDHTRYMVFKPCLHTGTPSTSMVGLNDCFQPISNLWRMGGGDIFQGGGGGGWPLKTYGHD